MMINKEQEFNLFPVIWLLHFQLTPTNSPKPPYRVKDQAQPEQNPRLKSKKEQNFSLSSSTLSPKPTKIPTYQPSLPPNPSPNSEAAAADNHIQ